MDPYPSIVSQSFLAATFTETLTGAFLHKVAQLVATKPNFVQLCIRLQFESGLEGKITNTRLIELLGELNVETLLSSTVAVHLEVLRVDALENLSTLCRNKLQRLSEEGRLTVVPVE